MGVIMNKTIIENELLTIETEQKNYDNLKKYILEISNSKKITKELYEKFCDADNKIRTLTYTRQQLYKDIVKTLFPDATSISCDGSCYFYLYGIRCALSKKDSQILIYTTFDLNNKLVITPFTKKILTMKKYYQAVDEYKPWKLLFDLRYPELKNKPVIHKFLKWFIFRKKDDRNYWEKCFIKEEYHVRESITEYIKRKDKTKMDLNVIIDKIIPEFETFTDNVKVLSDREYSLNELLEIREKMKLNVFDEPEIWDSYINKFWEDGYLQF